MSIVGQNLIEGLQDLAIQDQNETKANCTEPVKEINQVECETNSNHHGICAICRNKIVLQETALVKGCEHAYCVNCILKWASYKSDATCPQCKSPFEFLNIHRALDGSIQDYMFEESVHLLLRASWFKKPSIVVEQELVYEETEEYYYEEEDEEGEEDIDEVYLDRSGGLSLGNRRWGDNGYVRAGRQEARPAHRQETTAGTSRGPKKKEGASKEAAVGRRAKRALKREAADKAKQEEHLPGLGRVDLH